jgi:hypothetical protein
MGVSQQSKGPDSHAPGSGHMAGVACPDRYDAPRAHVIGTFREVTLGGSSPVREDQTGKFND